jgi:hypothetical protein
MKGKDSSTFSISIGNIFSKAAMIHHDKRRPLAISVTYPGTPKMFARKHQDMTTTYGIYDHHAVNTIAYKLIYYFP